GRRETVSSAPVADNQFTDFRQANRVRTIIRCILGHAIVIRDARSQTRSQFGHADFARNQQAVLISTVPDIVADSFYSELAKQQPCPPSSRNLDGLAFGASLTALGEQVQD